MGAETEVIFVEGHSRDDTWAVVSRTCEDYRGPLRVRAVRQSGTGKGDAVRLGFSLATNDILMILDGDLSVDPGELPRFYDAIVSGRGDFINGSRLVHPMEKRAMRFLNVLGNKFFGMMFTWILSQPVTDTLCGTKAVRAEDYARIAVGRSFFGTDDPFGDFDLLLGAAKSGLRIAEVTVHYRERTYGATNIHRFRHGVLLLRMTFLAAIRLKMLRSRYSAS